VPTLLSGALLSPAIVDCAGIVGRYLGVEQWPVWMGLLCFALLIGASALGWGFNRALPDAHPLLPIGCLGLLAMCLVDPLWSFMSPVFNARPNIASPVALAATLGYLALVVACIQSCGPIWRWVGRLICFLFLAVGIGLHAWWTADLGAALFISVASLVIGEGHFSWPMLAAFIAWPSSLIALFAGGFVWAPRGLLTDSRSRVGINLATYIDFLSSPSLAIAILLAGGISVFGFRFFFHQIRKLGKLDGRRKVLPLIALSSGAFGLLHPAFLLSSLVLATGATIALLLDAVQTM